MRDGGTSIHPALPQIIIVSAAHDGDLNACLIENLGIAQMGAQCLKACWQSGLGVDDHWHSCRRQFRRYAPTFFSPFEDDGQVFLLGEFQDLANIIRARNPDQQGRLALHHWYQSFQIKAADHQIAPLSFVIESAIGSKMAHVCQDAL